MVRKSQFRKIRVRKVRVRKLKSANFGAPPTKSQIITYSSHPKIFHKSVDIQRWRKEYTANWSNLLIRLIEIWKRNLIPISNSWAKKQNYFPIFSDFRGYFSHDFDNLKNFFVSKQLTKQMPCHLFCVRKMEIHKICIIRLFFLRD